MISLSGTPQKKAIRKCRAQYHYFNSLVTGDVYTFLFHEIFNEVPPLLFQKRLRTKDQVGRARSFKGGHVPLT